MIGSRRNLRRGVPLGLLCAVAEPEFSGDLRGRREIRPSGGESAVGRIVLAAVPVMAFSLYGALLTAAPPATADCVSSGGTTICSQGDVRGTDTGGGPTTGPYSPYPCEYDWYCRDDNFDVGIVLGAGDGDIGLPGTPGNRPEVSPRQGNSRPSGGRGRR